MSIAEEIIRIRDNISNAYTACESKGATLPQTLNSDNLAITIDSISGGGGSSATITAINKTGGNITAGSKVWLNENQQTQGSSYSIDTIALSSPTKSSGVISRTGNFAWRNNKLFSLGADSATQVNTFTASANSIKYGGDNSIFMMNGAYSYKVDETTQYSVSYFFIQDDYFSTNTQQIIRLNLADGSVKKVLGTVGSSYSSLFILNGKFYSVGTSAYKYIYNGESFDERTQINIQNGATFFYPIGVTADNKYVVGSSYCDYSNTTSSCFLRILEVIDEDNLKILTQSEMPEDLQEFYSISSRFVFNPYTGILTAVSYNSTSYAVMKYENGTWTKLPIDLGTGDLKLRGSLTLSDDLTRACIAYGDTGNWYAYIINLTSTSGYAAVPYRFYNVNENTITGYAGNNTEPNGEVTVGIGSVPTL